MIEFITPLHLALIPVILGLTGVVKLLPGFNTGYTPLVALAFGLVLSFLVGGTALVIVVSGLVIGLTACGLYSGTSAVRNVNQ